tara:strand:+ start:257 stop:724 length:468 start_codon:yes stop_codon:yes gene_type:complete
MNNLYYISIILLFLFLILSFVITPISFEEYFESDIDSTIPEVSINQDLQEKQKIAFDAEIFSSALENQEIEPTTSIESISGWTIQVKEYDNKEALMNGFRKLKDLGLKTYIQYKNNEENKFILYVGPTMDRDDSRDNLSKISDLTEFSPKIIPYE